MRNVVIFLILATLPISGIAQSKKSTSFQPMSISNIKLGMTSKDFLIKYQDSISGSATRKSSYLIKYERLVVNEIEIYDVLVTFFKDKLIDLYFKTNDPNMHWGLKAKYGYDSNEEYQQTYEGEEVTLGSYGKYSAVQGITHIVFSDGSEGFIMKDRKTQKLAQAEGF